MKTLQLLFFFLTAAVGGVVSSCATSFVKEAPELYRMLDADQKKVYVAYFPDLTRAQRKELLETQGSFYPLLREWGMETRFYQRQGGSAPYYRGLPENHSVQTVEILSDPEDPIYRGKKAKLRAVLKYTDGRKTDVTDEVTWVVVPHRARLSDNTLTFGCVHADVGVEADWMGARKGTRVIRLRKALTRLDVRLAPASVGSAHSEYLKFEAIASCEDGTKDDVSCAADWETDSNDVKQTGCGHLHLLEATRKDDTQIKVAARYGNLTSVSALNIPARKK
jgi:hypothetical protein